MRWLEHKWRSYAYSRVSSGMKLWKSIDKLVNWGDHSYRQEGRQEKCNNYRGISPLKSRAKVHAKCLEKNVLNSWTKVREYSVQFSFWSQPRKPNVHSPAMWKILGVCQRRLDMFCRSRKSIRPGSLWKYCGVLRESRIEWTQPQ